MQHRMHYLCLIPAAVLVGWLLLGGGGTALTGVGLFLLICPITMGVVMWLLMRQPGQGAHAAHDQSASHHEVSGRP